MCEMKNNMGEVMQMLAALCKQLGERVDAPANMPLSRYNKGDIIRLGLFNGIPPRVDSTGQKI